jgi:hypothetical protein
MKDELTTLEERKARRLESTRDQTQEPLMLHPGLAEVYRRKVEEPGELAIELVGELAEILALSNEKTPGLLGQRLNT